MEHAKLGIGRTCNFDSVLTLQFGTLMEPSGKEKDKEYFWCFSFGNGKKNCRSLDDIGHFSSGKASDLGGFYEKKLQVAAS